MSDTPDHPQIDYSEKAAAADKAAESAPSVQDAAAWRHVADTCRFIAEQRKLTGKHELVRGSTSSVHR